MSISIRDVALTTAAALAIFAMSATEVFAQGSAIPPTQINAVPNGLPPAFRDQAALDAYNAKMRRVITLVSTHQAGEVPETVRLKVILFIESLKKYNRDPELQRVLVRVSEETLSNYARYVNGLDKDDAKIRVVNSSDEDAFRTLMVGAGVIPNSPTAYGPAYQATRRTSTLERPGPVLAENKK
ncbi:MAG: hypothetical protein SFW65_04595 [Alphaproteobacteria bacterium]|nr:hypothetical protein [Alphaproteobacteria bacterium]